MTRAQSTLDAYAAKKVFKQVTDSIWCNLGRSLAINRMVPNFAEWSTKGDIKTKVNKGTWTDELEKMRENNVESSNDSYTVHADCLAANPKVKTVGEYF